MKDCPVCTRSKKEKLNIYSFIPSFGFNKCYNCKKKFIWVRLFNKNTFIKNESLLK